MKRALFLSLSLCAVTAVATPAPSTNDAVAVALSVPGVKRIIPTSYGYRLETDSGSRTAYRTATGYYVEGGGGRPSLEVRKNSTGFAVRGANRIVATSIGYRLETDAGPRTVYRTSTGYHVEGGRGTPSLDVRKTSTGFTVQDSGTRRDALRQKKKQGAAGRGGGGVTS